MDTLSTKEMIHMLQRAKTLFVFILLLVLKFCAGMKDSIISEKIQNMNLILHIDQVMISWFLFKFGLTRMHHICLEIKEDISSN